jgi:hypothetical protein
MPGADDRAHVACIGLRCGHHCRAGSDAGGHGATRATLIVWNLLHTKARELVEIEIVLRGYLEETAQRSQSSHQAVVHLRARPRQIGARLIQTQGSNHNACAQILARPRGEPVQALRRIAASPAWEWFPRFCVDGACGRLVLSVGPEGMRVI